MTEDDAWSGLARFAPLGILADLDGTLIPLRATPAEARLEPDLIALLNELSACPGLTLAVVSGRNRDALEDRLAACERVLLVAEHGGWRRSRGPWERVLDEPTGAIAILTEELRRLESVYPGAVVEEKTWSLAFHLRAVSPDRRATAEGAARERIQAFVTEHPRFAELGGKEIIEVRPARMRKSLAVTWVREHAGGGARLLALGDDQTDEDMFGALSEGDVAVHVGTGSHPRTVAPWRLGTPGGVQRFLGWILQVRRNGSPPVLDGRKLATYGPDPCPRPAPRSD